MIGLAGWHKWQSAKQGAGQLISHHGPLPCLRCATGLLPSDAQKGTSAAAKAAAGQRAGGSLTNVAAGGAALAHLVPALAGQLAAATAQALARPALVLGGVGAAGHAGQGWAGVRGGVAIVAVDQHVALQRRARQVPAKPCSGA